MPPLARRGAIAQLASVYSGSSSRIGWSPHEGQFGSRAYFTSRNLCSSASYSSSLPTSGSPLPSTSFTASTACTSPMIPGSTPRTPASWHEGASSGGGADKPDLRHEKPGLSDLADFGDEQVAAVAGALGIGQPHRHLQRQPGILPRREPTLHAAHPGVPHLSERLRRQQRAGAAGTI